MRTSLFCYTIFETGRTSLPYGNVLYCYAQEWALSEYSMLDVRLKQSKLSIDVKNIHLTK